MWLSGQPLAHNTILCAVPALKVSNNNDKNGEEREKKGHKGSEGGKKLKMMF